MSARQSVTKAANRLKATAHNRRDSPARKSQDAAPIGDAIRAYWDRDMVTFAIAAHHGVGVTPEFAHWAGIDAARADVPMSHGLDTRDRAWQVQSTRRSCSPRRSARSRPCSPPMAPP